MDTGADVPLPDDQPAPLTRAATALFIAGYLLVQVGYPMVPWFIGGDLAFTWRMFAGHDVETTFTVVNEDGTTQPVANALRARTAVRLRVLGPEVDQRRFLPPWLCAHWSGARSVVVRDRVTPHETVIPCQPLAR